MQFIFSLVLLITLSITFSNGQQQERFLGDLIPRSHGVSGKVYALDNRTLIVRNLNYDGKAPDAYFWVGETETPDQLGTPLADETGSKEPLKGYRDATVTLRLPEHRSLRRIKSFGLWCRIFRENFAHIRLNVA